MIQAIGRTATTLLWLAAAGAAALLAAAFGPTLLGAQSMIVTSGSMGGAMPSGSVAVTRLVDVRAIGPGDVVSFRHPGASQATTHRVIDVAEEEGRRVFTTKGDANPAPDPEPVYVSDRIHRVERVIPFAGTLVRYARSPAGGVALFLVPMIGLAADRRRGNGRREREPRVRAARDRSEPRVRAARDRSEPRVRAVRAGRRSGAPVVLEGMPFVEPPPWLPVSMQLQALAPAPLRTAPVAPVGDEAGLGWSVATMTLVRVAAPAPPASAPLAAAPLSLVPSRDEGVAETG